jgi:hypothetical protein
MFLHKTYMSLYIYFNKYKKKQKVFQTNMEINVIKYYVVYIS